MKCAKCGREVDNNAPRCPWCEANGNNGCGGNNSSATDDDVIRCPLCGSRNIVAIRKDYDPGCGCLGLLLFSWIGLLLGFLGGGDVEMKCMKCGAGWPAGRPHRAGVGRGCFLIFLLIILAILIFR